MLAPLSRDGARHWGGPSPSTACHSRVFYVNTAMILSGMHLDRISGHAREDSGREFDQRQGRPRVPAGPGRRRRVRSNEAVHDERNADLGRGRAGIRIQPAHRGRRRDYLSARLQARA
jgi:hypothetical protein